MHGLHHWFLRMQFDHAPFDGFGSEKMPLLPWIQDKETDPLPFL